MSYDFLKIAQSILDLCINFSHYSSHNELSKHFDEIEERLNKIEQHIKERGRK